MFTRAVAMGALLRLTATIQTPTAGTMPQSPICLRRARLPPRVFTMVDGYLRVARSASLPATVRSPGPPLPIPGITCQTWYRRAIPLRAQPLANLFTPSPATPPPVFLPTTTSSTPRPAAPHQNLARRQHPPPRRQQQQLQHRRLPRRLLLMRLRRPELARCHDLAPRRLRDHRLL